ncbi:MAG: DUF2333 family protein [Aeromonadales bacterium]|nr:DUF2333 family protein [Aeromonadales bacterium]MDY2891947.1 DUF2333 family protein [Succinivibrio sp.]
MFTLRKLKYALAIIVGLYVLYILAVGLISSPSGELYKPQMLDQNATDQDRAMVLAEGVTHALGEQLSTLFGWLPNDLLLVPQILDNTVSYQSGVIYATRPASDMIAKTATRYGKTDTIDKRLVDATSRYFTYSEKVWGFWFIYDAEGKYKEGIKNWRAWASSVGTNAKNAGVYNVKTDDTYQIIKYCANMTDYALGILNNEKMGHFESDNNIYYTKGICAVVSNVLRALVAVDSSVVERGGQENVDEALRRLDYVAEFNPLYCVAGGNEIGDAMLPNHVAALARHIDVANNRINDMLDSMEK